MQTLYNRNLFLKLDLNPLVRQLVQSSLSKTIEVNIQLYSSSLIETKGVMTMRVMV